ncbi:MAG TPA: hydroxysqualene dehydroxylase HpnE [Candidatus Binatia bacterium]|nr:hydroxysqualene dehydroxylase HpnE [Candidatus Binatia bacterium]
MKKRVVVVGGGWAGLCAALGLAERGVEVQLFEKRAVLGGRAYSYRAREAGHAVDNGQHLLMGCYHATMGFLGRIGAADRVEIQPELRVPFFHPLRGPATFACAAAPSPLHLTLGAMRYTLLSPAERLQLVLGGLRIALRYRGGSAFTVAQALAAARQSGNLCKCFWNPLAIAVLNELPERASADLFAEVLRRVFFAGRAASCIVFPKVGLSDLCAEPAARAIEDAAGRIETGPAVREVAIRSGRATGVLIQDRPEIPADAVILAVPPPALASLLPTAVGVAAGFPAVEKLHGAPIVSVHFWFHKSFGSPRMAGFLDGPIHWLFTPPMQPENGRYVTLVVSGAHELVVKTPDEILRIARGELARYLPQTQNLQIADSLVVKETNATFAATPEEQPHRARTRTPIANLFLAGDWTNTGLPATLESAVLSGDQAATAAAEYLAAA